VRQSRGLTSFIREMTDHLPPTRYILLTIGICLVCAALGLAIDEFGPPPSDPDLADALAKGG